MVAVELVVWPGVPGSDLASLDPSSQVAASYLQLFRPGDWQLSESSDTGLSPSGSLPVLRSAAEGVKVAGAPAILRYLEREALASSSLTERKRADAAATHALLDSAILPLVLHSLYSLPHNWRHVRSTLAPRFAYPARLYHPDRLREEARTIVEAANPQLWGLGGEVEQEDEEERRKRRTLLEGGAEGIEKRKENERREGKQKTKHRFAEGKLVAEASKILDALEGLLSKSSTAFFYSSPNPTSLDAHVAALLAPVLFLPLPQPVLSKFVNASHSRLWTHATLMRRTLWGEQFTLPPVTSVPTLAWTSLAKDILLPQSVASWLQLSHGVERKKTAARKKTETRAEKDFRWKRNIFLLSGAAAFVGWAVLSGAVGFVPSLDWRDASEQDLDDEEDE